MHWRCLIDLKSLAGIPPTNHVDDHRCIDNRGASIGELNDPLRSRFELLASALLATADTLMFAGIRSSTTAFAPLKSGCASPASDTLRRIVMRSL